MYRPSFAHERAAQRAGAGRDAGRNYQPRVALDRIAANPLDTQRPTTNSTKRKKIGSRRGIAFNINFARTTIELACLNNKFPPAFPLDHHTKALHQI